MICTRLAPTLRVRRLTEGFMPGRTGIIPVVLEYMFEKNSGTTDVLSVCWNLTCTYGKKQRCQAA